MTDEPAFKLFGGGVGEGHLHKLEKYFQIQEDMKNKQLQLNADILWTLRRGVANTCI